MKIQVQDLSENGEVFVWGVWGPKTIEKILGRLNKDIENVNKSLRRLYEQN